MGYIPMEFPDTISGASEAQAFKWKSSSHLDFELVTQRRSGPPNHSGQVITREAAEPEEDATIDNLSWIWSGRQLEQPFR